MKHNACKVRLWLFGFVTLIFSIGIPLYAQQDDTNSFEIVKAKAESGDVPSECLFGIFYSLGKFVDKNPTEAVKWFRKAAESGDSWAEYFLGDSYHYGTGVTQSWPEAVKWYRKSADQGFANAELAIGSCYFSGFGVETNLQEGLKWWRLAANQGNPYAEAKLGDCYYYGNAIVRDYVEAAKWYRKAAEQGVASGAQFMLGLCYLNGYGVTRDYVEAYKWLNLAAAQGVAEAQRLRAVVEIKMTPEQIAEAQRLAASFVPRNETPGSNSNSIFPVTDDSPKACGTGFFITDDGYFISNNHVVKDATKIRIVTSAGTFDAKVIQTDAANDLALLKVEGHFTALPIAPSRKVSLGSTVATVGFPDPGLEGFSPKLAKGEIASLSGAGDDARYFQISVPVQPGNSGGALVDEHGNVVGIVSAKLNAAAALASSGSLPENVNYAIKSSYLLSFLESVPAVSAKLKDPLTADQKFEDVVKSAQNAAVLVLVY